MSFVRIYLFIVDFVEETLECFGLRVELSDEEHWVDVEDGVQAGDDDWKSIYDVHEEIHEGSYEFAVVRCHVIRDLLMRLMLLISTRIRLLFVHDFDHLELKEQALDEIAYGHAGFACYDFF